jgi:hypothetical protein
VGPADQELGGHDGPDAGLGEEGGAGRVLADQPGELGVQLSELGAEEADAGRDRLQDEDRGAVLDAGAC